MARLGRQISTTPARGTASSSKHTTASSWIEEPSRSAQYDASQLSPSGVSDKENQPTPAATARNKGKGRMDPPGGLISSNSANAPHSAKRRRVDVSQNSRADHAVEEDLDERKYYNPDQDPEERQALKRQSRALEREFNDNRDVYLRTDNNGLERTINQANSIFEGVKQTSDATLDSRLMVNVSDLLAKKSAQMVLGDSSTGLDVDEFVSKCISFMNRENVDSAEREAAPSATQRRRRLQTRRDHDDDDDEEEDNHTLDWAVLGAKACFPFNVRPPTPGFLLGPLSVQKKARTQTQRRARQVRDAGGTEVRPEALTKDDLGQTESNTLTVICSKIRDTLQHHCDRAESAAEAAGELTEDLMRKYRIGDTGGPHLFDFVVNPFSFGQTVENIFYVSFLIKEGNVGVDMDSDGLPTLIPAGAAPDADKRGKGSKKHQAVFSMDFETWKKLIRAFDIQEPLIEHRTEQSTQVGSRGWYA